MEKVISVIERDCSERKSKVQSAQMALVKKQQECDALEKELLKLQTGASLLQSLAPVVQGKDVAFVAQIIQ